MHDIPLGILLNDLHILHPLPTQRHTGHKPCPLFLAVAEEMALHGFVAFLSAFNVTDDDFFHASRMGRALVVEKGCDSREKEPHEKQRHENS